jgi:hypothetical protein
MRLLESLRKAEEQGRRVARYGRDWAGEAWEDAERRIRRKMRIHPKGLANRDVVAEQTRDSANANATSSSVAAGGTHQSKPTAA